MQEMWEMQVRSLGREGPLEKGMATHSSILAWRVPWTEALGSPWGCIESDMTACTYLASVSRASSEIRRCRAGLCWQWRQSRLLGVAWRGSASLQSIGWGWEPGGGLPRELGLRVHCGGLGHCFPSCDRGGGHRQKPHRVPSGHWLLSAPVLFPTGSFVLCRLWLSCWPGWRWEGCSVSRGPQKVGSEPNQGAVALGVRDLPRPAFPQSPFAIRVPWPYLQLPIAPCGRWASVSQVKEGQGEVGCGRGSSQELHLPWNKGRCTFGGVLYCEDLGWGFGEEVLKFKKNKTEFARVFFFF